MTFPAIPGCARSALAHGLCSVTPAGVTFRNDVRCGADWKLREYQWVSQFRYRVNAMEQSESEIAVNAMFLGISLAEKIRGLPVGSLLHDAELPIRLQEVAAGTLIFTASGAEIRKLLPNATEETRARSQKDMQEVARLIVTFIKQPFL